jgi:proline iminopeptidase
MSSSPAEQAQVHTATSQLTVFIHQGAGKTILLLHGGPGVPDYLEPVAAMLAPRYRVARYDQRGVGKSLALNGSYSLEEHLADLDAVRSYLGVPQLHLFGHSWGGLLAQLYWSKHPERTASLLLCNSSTGVGRQWATMEVAVMRYNRAQAGLLGWSAMGLWSLLSRVPGRAGRSAARRMMAQVWRNYFPDPKQAPAPDRDWLAGVSAAAIQGTRRALLRAPPASLTPGTANLELPVLVLFGGRDIYGAEVDTLLARFPSARQVRLERSGHLPWLQDRAAFAQVVDDFYGSIP